MVVAASRNHLYRRRLQVVIDAGPRNHLYLLGQQVKIRSSPRNQLRPKGQRKSAAGAQDNSPGRVEKGQIPAPAQRQS